MVKVLCKVDHLNYDGNDNQYVGYRAGKVYDGEVDGEIIRIKSEPDLSGKTRTKELLKGWLPGSVFEIEGKSRVEN